MERYSRAEAEFISGVPATRLEGWTKLRGRRRLLAPEGVGGGTGRHVRYRRVDLLRAKVFQSLQESLGARHFRPSEQLAKVLQATLTDRAVEEVLAGLEEPSNTPRRPIPAPSPINQAGDDERLLLIYRPLKPTPDGVTGQRARELRGEVVRRQDLHKRNPWRDSFIAVELHELARGVFHRERFVQAQRALKAARR